MSKWAAVYLPEDDEYPGNRYDFDSEYEAEQYVLSRMCRGCKAERQQALDGTDDEASEYPGCFVEWHIGLTSECYEFRMKVPRSIIEKLRVA